MRRLETLLMIGVGLTLLTVVARASWIEAKAWLAQVLIERAWHQTLQSGQPVRPWPWADTWPVAQLVTPGGDTLYVLESASGQALAFGPGRVPTHDPHASGLLIAGHQDTHFRFLRDIAPGEQLLLQNPDGKMRSYQVSGMRVVDARLELMLPPGHRDELMLVSCYPFRAAPAGGPLRYVVYARAGMANAGEQAQWIH